MHSSSSSKPFCLPNFRRELESERERERKRMKDIIKPKPIPPKEEEKDNDDDDDEWCDVGVCLVSGNRGSFSSDECAFLIFMRR